jgi:sarcosine oxidase subunit gamma
MSEAVSPLAGAAYEGFVRVRDADLIGMVSLRADIADAGVIKILRDVGITMPKVGRMVRGDVSALWMSPDEVLLLTDYAHAPALTETLTAALAGQHALVHTVSDARACLRVEGPAVRDVLAKLCPVDVANLAPGEVRRTRLAQVAAALWLEDPQTAQIICFRSVAAYAFDTLSMAARPGSQPHVFAQ